MIKITNGQTVVEVSNGAYESIYKSLGYYPLKKGKGSGKSSEALTEVSDDLPNNEIENVEEKPLSKWDKNEVKAFAAEHNIDISSTKNINEAKDIIEKFLEG